MPTHADSDQAEPLRVEWASAVVEDAQLTVELDGEPATEWEAGFRAVLERLRRPVGAWGEVELEGRYVRVADVTQGAEPELRHLLESAVLQANASAGLTTPDPGDGDDNGEDAEDAEDGPTADQEMTERFRSFAEPRRP